jgi:predicted HAD superfamily Cof-like phosphohydrolase
MEVNVREFHEKHGFVLDQKVVKTPSCLTLALQLEDLAVSILDDGLKEQRCGNPAKYRLHLMVEELSEVADAMTKGDETALADALADLIYVAHGTAETYNIPISEVLYEVHRSNMTKKVRNEANDRMRDKGPDYVAPDIAGAIKRGRETREWNKTLKEEVGQ